MLAVAVAVGAALCYGLASALQQHAAARAPTAESLRIGLLARLVRRPLWLAGGAADLAGFALQFAALSRGALVVVQPILVLSLLFALPIGARLGASRDREERARIAAPVPAARPGASGPRAAAELEREPPVPASPASPTSRWRNLVAGVALCAGVAVFLAAAAPSNGAGELPLAEWLAVLGGCGALVLVLALGGRRVGGRLGPVLLSTAAGILYALAAALTKATGTLLGEGLLRAIESWELVALVVVGASALLVSQSAFQAGSLELSLPSMTVANPIVSILLGTLAFGEHLATAPLAVVGEVLGLAALSVGVFALARSPAARVATHGGRPTPDRRLTTPRAPAPRRAFPATGRRHRAG